MKTRNIITAVIAIIAGAITVWQFGTSLFGIMSGVNVAVIITIGGVYIGAILDRKEDEKQGFAIKDEMSIQIEGKAGRLAFQVGNYIWLALLWYEFLSAHWLPTPTIGSPAIIIIGMLAQVGVYFVAMYYYWKKKP
jgi:hypothetical protein